MYSLLVVFISGNRLHTIGALVTGVQTRALPIYRAAPPRAGRCSCPSSSQVRQTHHGAPSTPPPAARHSRPAHAHRPRRRRHAPCPRPRSLPQPPPPRRSPCPQPADAPRPACPPPPLPTASRPSPRHCHAQPRPASSCAYSHFLKLGDQHVDIGHLDPGLPLGRLFHLQRRQPGRHVDAVIRRRLARQRLGFRLHDVGKRRIARLVEPQIGRDDRRKLQVPRLQRSEEHTAELQYPMPYSASVF